MLGEVVLIGKGPGFEKAPLYGSGVETWGVNDVCGHRQCDVVFWMDKEWLQGSTMDNFIVASVNKTKTKTYSTKVWEDIPTSERYPLEDVTNFIGVDYFGDSCSYMIALAIFQGYKTITMYGFNYAFGSNYVHEKPCVEFWLGVALRHGCTMNIQGEVSDLLQTKPRKLYAFRTPETFKRTDIKMGAELPPVEEKEYTFSVSDRVVLMKMLPKNGNYDLLKASKTLHSKLWFRDEESKLLNMREVEGPNGPVHLYDDTKIEPIKVSMTTTQQRMIQLILTEVNAKHALTEETFDLYEKFMVN